MQATLTPAEAGAFPAATPEAVPATIGAPIATTATVAQATDKAEALPNFVLVLFQIFAVVIYGPDMFFGYQVYTANGKLIGPISSDNLAPLGLVILFATLSAGTVGMAYLCSVLAPWHWAKGRHVVAVICGIGVVIATGVTILFSLAYRSDNPVSYAFDGTIQGWMPFLKTWNISPIQTIAAFAPPFWGLFWAFVQPTRKQEAPDLATAALTHEAKLLRIQQQAEEKEARAQANAKSRAAQLAGIAQTVRDARNQANAPDASTPNTPAAAAVVTALPSRVSPDASSQSGAQILAQIMSGQGA